VKDLYEQIQEVMFFLSFAYATLLILLEHWPGFGWIRSAGGIIDFPEGTHRKGVPELTQASWMLMPSFLGDDVYKSPYKGSDDNCCFSGKSLLQQNW